MPEKVACLIDDLKMHWKNCGTGFELKRKFGEHKIKTCAKFDEEFCEIVPECGEEKCIFTKVGCGKYKCFVKDDKGGKVEWCWEFCDDGLTIVSLQIHLGVIHKPCGRIFGYFCPPFL